MRASLQVVGVALAFTIISLSPIAAADPKEEVASATAAWAQALGEDDPDKVLPLDPATPSFGARYPRNSGPIRQRGGTISWAPLKLFRV